MDNSSANKPSTILANDVQIYADKSMSGCTGTKYGPASNKRTMLTLSFALTVALGMVVMIIGTSSAEASSLPTFTVANALSAKQDVGIAGVATASVALIAFAALALVSKKPR